MMTQPATGRAARLEDVAALAGVSTATASKALHTNPVSAKKPSSVYWMPPSNSTTLPTNSPNPWPAAPPALSAWSPPICRAVSPHRFLSARRTSCEHNRPQYCWPTLVATPRWNVSMSRNCCPSRSTACSSCSAKPTPGPRLAMTGACHWSTSTAPPPTQRLLGHLRQRGRRSHGHQPSHLVWPPAHRHYRRRRNLYRCHRPHQGRARGTG